MVKVNWLQPEPQEPLVGITLSRTMAQNLLNLLDVDGRADTEQIFIQLLHLLHPPTSYAKGTEMSSNQNEAQQAGPPYSGAAQGRYRC